MLPPFSKVSFPNTIVFPLRFLLIFSSKKTTTTKTTSIFRGAGGLNRVWDWLRWKEKKHIKKLIYGSVREALTDPSGKLICKPIPDRNHVFLSFQTVHIPPHPPVRPPLPLLPHSQSSHPCSKTLCFKKKKKLPSVPESLKFILSFQPEMVRTYLRSSHTWSTWWLHSGGGDHEDVCFRFDCCWKWIYSQLKPKQTEPIIK